MNIGDKVTIKECHAQPELVGKEAKILSMADPALVKYPVLVLLTEELTLHLETSMGMAEGKTHGPFPFREDELELVKPQDVPDEFKKAWDGGV